MRTTHPHSRAAEKRLAAERAAELVMSGMIVGLGSGSTARYAIRHLSARLQAGVISGIVGVPTSRAVARLARRLAIPLLAEDLPETIDLTIDGADEIDPNLCLIKGGGGALLREKIVAQASRREVIVVDEGKLSGQLGVNRPLPVEVLPFGWRDQGRFLTRLGANVTLRMSGAVAARTDQGNFLLDCWFGPITEPATLAAALDARAGVVGHGLFVNLATDVIVGGQDGVRLLRREPATAPDRGFD